MNIASWIWVLIPLAAIGITPFKMWIKVKEKQIEAQTSLAAEKSAQYAAHVERIEARLRVLEQIVTEALEHQQQKSRYRIPDRPGLGIELNDDYLARFDRIVVGGRA